MVERVLVAVVVVAVDADTGTYLSKYALESSDVMLKYASRRVRNAAAAEPGLDSGGGGRGEMRRGR
jgi:hypothetical protein